MSTPSPDDTGALSPAERDFLARRMPVDASPPRRTVSDAMKRLRAFENALSRTYPMSGAILADLISDLEKALK